MFCGVKMSWNADRLIDFVNTIQLQPELWFDLNKFIPVYMIIILLLMFSINSNQLIDQLIQIYF